MCYGLDLGLMRLGMNPSSVDALHRLAIMDV